MSELIDELRQHALMCANNAQNANPDTDTTRVAYARAKTFTGINCPECWVREEHAFKLEVEAHASDSDLYRCKNCDFEGVFPKAG